MVFVTRRALATGNHFISLSLRVTRAMRSYTSFTSAGCNACSTFVHSSLCALRSLLLCLQGILFHILPSSVSFCLEFDSQLDDHRSVSWWRE